MGNKMNYKIIAILVTFTAGIAGCSAVPEGLTPVTGFETERYLGKWYEIARLDHRFERNLNNVSATYTRSENGEIQVLNRGYDVKTKEWKEIEGHARLLEGETVGSLKVSFFGPFYGGYHIIELDEQNYSYSMVSGPSRSYLWILARTTTLDDAVYEELVAKASGWGFDTAGLIKVEHNVPDD